MRDRVDTRLAELRRERADGLARLARIECERRELESTLLRIQGGIQVLEELSGEVVSLQERRRAEGKDPGGR